MKYLTVGELKKLIENVDDNAEVTIAYPSARNNIVRVNSVGLLQCENEDDDAIGFMSDDNTSIKEETDYCIKELFNGFKEEDK